MKFRDRIRNVQKFNKPDATQTWPDFLQQLVWILRLYRVPSNEWAGWLTDRLAGKAQSALMNLTERQRGDWAELVAALNSYFHVEVEMRTAEEELLVRKQNPKESVREFIAHLMFLARKAYGADQDRREATVIKRLELGLASATLRHAFDDMMLQPGMTLSILQRELVRKESREDPARYQTFVAQEKEVENKKKPQNAPVATVVAEVLQQTASGGETAEVNVTQGKARGRGAPKGVGGGNPGGGRGRGSNGAPGARPGRGHGRGRWRDDSCWHCGVPGHIRTRCRSATPEQIQEWEKISQERREEREKSKGSAEGQGAKGAAPNPKSGH